MGESLRDLEDVGLDACLLETFLLGLGKLLDVAIHGVLQAGVSGFSYVQANAICKDKESALFCDIDRVMGRQGMDWRGKYKMEKLPHTNTIATLGAMVNDLKV